MINDGPMPVLECIIVSFVRSGSIKISHTGLDSTTEAPIIILPRWGTFRHWSYICVPCSAKKSFCIAKKITMIMVIGSSTTKGDKYCLAPTCGTGANPAAIYVIRYASN